MDPDVLIRKPPREREKWMDCALTAIEAELKAQQMLSKPKQPARGKRGRRGR